MGVHLSLTEDEIVKAADKPLQIIDGYQQNLRSHIATIRQKILVDEDTLISILAALNAGFNIILYGPPGTAKSTLSELLPKQFYGAKCNVHTADSEWNVRKVIGGLTVSYSYDDNGVAHEVIAPQDGYIVEDILECYSSRLYTTEFDTVFTVIDEFNRTNMDECLGPMFTAMGSDNKLLKLDYNKGFNDGLLSIPIPKGYRMICNMNKHDRTFTNELSEALSRRFKWIYLGIPTDYPKEEEIVNSLLFGNLQQTTIDDPVQVEDGPSCIDSTLFNEMICHKINTIINTIREDVDIGTAYKIDAIKLANHFWNLKLSLVDWSTYQGITRTSVENAANLGAFNPPLEKTLAKALQEVVTASVDAALVMTIVPACEVLEDDDAITKVKELFVDYPRCQSELARMKMTF